MPGASFAGYTIQRLIGTGDAGPVYEAVPPERARRVALRLLHPELTADATVRSRLEQAVAAAKLLSHANIAHVEDAGVEGDCLWIASRYVDGVSVAAASPRGPATADEAAWIVSGVAAALDHAHRNQVLHGDIRPANILVERDGANRNGRVVLADFGVASALRDVADPSTPGDRLYYLAPERFSGSSNDVAAEVYALGATLFQLLVGRTPYAEVPAAQLAHAHRMAAIPRPSALRPGMSPAWDAVIERSLAKDPNDRYRSCGELAAAAGRALSAHPQAAHPPAPAALAPDAPQPPPSHRRRWLTIAGVAAVLAIIAGTTFAIAGNTSHRSDKADALREEPHWGRPIVLPFGKLGQPHGIAIDPSGTLYVVDFISTPHVVALAPQAQQAQPLAFDVNELNQPEAVAVDAARNVYVTDAHHKRVVKLAAGSKSSQDLPFSGLSHPAGVAVDSDGNVYITDQYDVMNQTGRDRVLELPAGSHDQQELAFSGLKSPTALAVGSDGAVYVADTFNERVLKLDKGSHIQTELAFTGLDSTYGVAVDAAGNVYATTLNARDPNAPVNIFNPRLGKVVRLSSRTGQQQTLPFGDLNWPWGVAVDAEGNVYVAEADANRPGQVIKLPR